MATKLKAMESKLLAATYTQDSVSAMESIAGHLDEEMHQLKSKNQQVRAQHHVCFQQQLVLCMVRCQCVRRSPSAQSVLTLAVDSLPVPV